MKKTNIKVLKNIDNGKIVHIEFIDGREYKLQHPGNRAKLQWEKEYFNPVTGIDQEKFLDIVFENCVIPINHGFKPTIDDVRAKDLEVWAMTLRRFLGGDLEQPVAGPDEGTENGGPKGRRVAGDKE